MTSEYTPTTEQMRSRASLVCHQGGCNIEDRERGIEFDRFLAKIKADALREAQANVRASSFWADGSDNYADRVRGYLGREADRIERGDA